MKKGFTLAELIGVIVVLALIALIAVPAVSDVLSSNKKKLCEVQMENILSAARSWGANNIASLPSGDGEIKTIGLSDLIKGGYIDSGITNPITKDPIPEDVEIVITRVGKKYTYDFKNDEYKVPTFCNTGSAE